MLQIMYWDGCHSHMKCHVVRSAVSVLVSDVMNSTDGHDDLANGIHNGQVDDGSAWKNWLKRWKYSHYTSGLMQLKSCVY